MLKRGFKSFFDYYLVMSSIFYGSAIGKISTIRTVEELRSVIRALHLGNRIPQLLEVTISKKQRNPSSSQENIYIDTLFLGKDNRNAAVSILLVVQELNKENPKQPVVINEIIFREGDQAIVWSVSS